MERKTFDDDLNLDDPLEKLNSNLMWKTKQKQELKNRIIYRIETLEVKAVGEENIRLIRLEKRFSIKKVIYTGIALTLLIGLFIGSAFISPAMAKVAAKIPYLNKIFQSKPINQTIWNELEEKGYHISGVSGSAGQIIVKIEGSEEYFQDVRKETEEITANILKSKDYDADKIEVERQIDIVPEPMSERDQTISNALEESFNQLMDMKINVLSHGHSYPAPNSNEVIVHFSIPDTEKRIEEIKDIINESLIEKHIQSYSIKINQINLNQSEKESNWSDIFRVIIDGLTAKKEYKVTGFAYSFHPAPLQIIIKTSINESDENAYEQVLKIENTIHEFLSSEEIKEKIAGDPFEIIIRGKNREQLN